MRSRKQRMGIVAGGFIVHCVCAVAVADTWYVSATAAPGGDGGSWTTAFDTIQEGIDAASSGDTVLLGDGTYRGDGNKNLDTAGKAIIVKGASGVPALCVIDCEEDGRGFRIQHGEGNETRLEYLTICNGYVDHSYPGDGLGGGVHCQSTSPTIRNCIFTNCYAMYGGALNSSRGNPVVISCVFQSNTAASIGGAVRFLLSTGTFVNCLLRENRSFGKGGGVYLSEESDATFTNCTFFRNQADLAGGGIYEYGSYSKVINCIAWDNSPESFVISWPSIAMYSNVQGGQGNLWFRTGCIDADPMFASDTDLHLINGSPCIDAGINTVDGGLPLEDLDGNARLLDGDGDSLAVVDMGPYEYQAPLRGDLDEDGDVDLHDLALFVQCLAGPNVTDVPAGVDPVMFVRADLDNDGDVDLKDFAILQPLISVG